MIEKELFELHQQAMFFAQDALVATQHKEIEKAFTLNQKAFELERQVALSLVNSKNEPMRSIILKSAATLALDIGQYREAEIFISYGLIGTPPDDIHQDFLALLDTVKQQRLSKEKIRQSTKIFHLKKQKIF